MKPKTIIIAGLLTALASSVLHAQTKGVLSANIEGTVDKMLKELNEKHEREVQIIYLKAAAEAEKQLAAAMRANNLQHAKEAEYLARKYNALASTLGAGQNLGKTPPPSERARYASLVGSKWKGNADRIQGDINIYEIHFLKGNKVWAKRKVEQWVGEGSWYMDERNGEWYLRLNVEWTDKIVSRPWSLWVKLGTERVRMAGYDYNNKRVATYERVK